MKTTIGVIFGGMSVEHEISVISALQAIKVIDSNKYQVVPIYISKDGKWYSDEKLLDVNTYKDLSSLSANCAEIYVSTHSGEFAIYQKSFFKRKPVAIIQIAFPILHGTNGEDGTVQGFLELKNIPYVGSNVLASAVGMDKVVMKMVLRASDIPVVDYVWFYDKDWHKNRAELQADIEKIGYPVIVKPANLGSSVGISKATNSEELNDAVEMAGMFTNRILVEKMVTELQEINCSVIGDNEDQQASVCEEPMRSGDILSYDDKYVSNSKGSSTKGMSSTKRQIPANLTDEVTAQIQDLAKKTFKVLDGAGVARIDFMVDKSDGAVYVNEINSIPGSLSFYLWEATDKKFPVLVNELINVAMKRHREKGNYMVSYNQNIFNINTDSLKLGKG